MLGSAKPATFALFAAIGPLVLAGCESRASTTPAGHLARYELARAPDASVNLPIELREISGLAVAPDGRVFAHGDEDGTVFELDPSTGKVVKRFALQPGPSAVDLGKKPKDGQVTGDFEDLTIVDDRFFLVTSGGVLLEFGEGKDGERVPFTAHPTALDQTCEVEGMAHDAASQSLLLLCKQMREKSRRDRVEIFSWSLGERQLATQPRWSIPFSALAAVTRSKEFNGSALAFIPGSTTLALIAGPQRLFAELDGNGRPIAGGGLSQTALPQPEGIAFLPDGTLLVSSEGGKGIGTIAIYRPS